MSRPTVSDPFAADLTRALASLRSTARRGLSAPLFGAVPVLERWLMPWLDAAGPCRLPAVRVSPRRPDVADLARVLGTEGTGTVWSSWRYLPGHGFTADRVTLDLKILRPVRAAFVLALTVPRDRWLLDATVQSGRLGLTGSPRGRGPLTVLTFPSADELGRVLAAIDGEG
jgi:hypothetical protein